MMIHWTLLVFLSCLVQMVSSCFICCNCGWMLPNDPYYFLGEEIHVTCRVDNPDELDGQFLPGYSWNASLLYFTNLERYSDLIKLDKNGTLVFSKIADEEDLTYFKINMIIDCKIRGIAKGNEQLKYIGSQVIRIDRRPQNLTDQEVSCQWWNWNARIDCRWPMPYLRKNDMSVNASMIYTNGNTIGECIVNDVNKSSCSINSGFHLDGKSYQLILNITNTKKKTYSVSYINFTKRENVKVQPITYINQSYTNRPSCLNLSWGFDSDFVYSRSLWYHIKIVPLSPWINPEDIQEFYPASSDKYITLDGLHPFSEYKVTISSQPPESKYRSDPLSTIVTTDEGVPGAPPIIIPGSYTNNDTSQTCSSGQIQSIEIFWQKIPEFFQHSKILKYVVTATPAQNPNQTVTVEVEGKHTTSCSLHLPCGYDYLVNVRAASVKGLSENASQITIKRFDEVAISSSEIVVELDDEIVDVLNYNISWPLRKRKEKEPIGYRVFYGEQIGSGSRKQPVEWVDVANNQSSIIISFNTSDLYGFGVSVIESKEYATGFEFQNCYFFKNRAPPKVEKVWVEPSANNALTVSWKAIECDRSKNIPVVEMYTVFWCRASQNSCNDLEKSLKQESTNERYVVVLPNLQGNERYRIQMQAISKQGKRGAISDPVFETTTDTVLKVGTIVSISIGGILLILVVVLLAFHRKLISIYRQRTKKVEISIPNPLEIPVKHTEPDQDSGRGSSYLYPSFSSDSSAAALTLDQNKCQVIKENVPSVAKRSMQHDSQLEHSNISSESNYISVMNKHHYITLERNSFNSDGNSNSKIQEECKESSTVCVLNKDTYIHLEKGLSDKSSHSNHDTMDCNNSREGSNRISQGNGYVKKSGNELRCYENKLTNNDIKDCLIFGADIRIKNGIFLKPGIRHLSDSSENQIFKKELKGNGSLEVIGVKNRNSYIQLGDSSGNAGIDIYFEPETLSESGCHENESAQIQSTADIYSTTGEIVVKNHFEFVAPKNDELFTGEGVEPDLNNVTSNFDSDNLDLLFQDSACEQLMFCNETMKSTPTCKKKDVKENTSEQIRGKNGYRFLIPERSNQLNLVTDDILNSNKEVSTPLRRCTSTDNIHLNPMHSEPQFIIKPLSNMSTQDNHQVSELNQTNQNIVLNNIYDKTGVCVMSVAGHSGYVKPDTVCKDINKNGCLTLLSNEKCSASFSG